MIISWSLVVIQVAFPLFMVFSHPVVAVQPQALGLFSNKFEELYNDCLTRSAEQTQEITRLNIALTEAATKLADVNSYQDLLDRREENLNDREAAINQREQALEQKIFDFTKQVEDVARSGGRAEKTIAENEQLKNRVDRLETQLDQDRNQARENLERDRAYWSQRLEDEKNDQDKLQNRLDTANQLVLIIEAIVGGILLATVATILLLYVSWRKGNLVPINSPGLVLDVTESSKQLAPQQDQ